MKLLKLTIVNMASLEGEHVIDFEKEPLKSTGLFSIVGDTGSGKSTILDAICLALYGLAPRFFDSKKIEFYNNETNNNNRYLQPDDPRNILRRGMKECSSEVVFLARDNHRYRARWACSIARTNFTKPERSLYKTVIGVDGKATEEKLEISNEKGYGRKNVANNNLNRIIGLDYNQFTRTALLAQNSFANFLKADATDKAILLEMLTGTELYTKVANKIYEKYKIAEISYNELKNTLEGIRAGLLPEDRLSQLRQESASLDKEMTGLRDRQDLLQKRKQLLDNASQLLSDIENLRKQHDEKTALLQSRKDALQKEQDLLTSKRVEQERLAPEIAKARETKVEVKAKKSLLDTLQSDVSLLKRNIATLSKDIESNSKNQEAEQNRLKSSEDRIAQLAAHQSMLDNAEAVKVRIEGFYSLVVKYNNDKKNIAILRKQLSTRQEKLNEDKSKLHKSEETLAEEKRRIDEEDGLLGQVDIAQLQNQLSQLKDLIDALREWTKLLKKKDDLTSEMKNADEALSSYRKQLSEVEKQKNQLVEECADIDKLLPGMEDAYRLMSSKDVTRLRSELKEGEPCPVCGSTSHPYAHDIEAALSPLKDKIDSKRQRKNEITDLMDNPKTGINLLLADLKAKIERETFRKQQTQKQHEEADSRLKELQNEHPEISSDCLDKEISSAEENRKAVKKSYDEWADRQRKLTVSRTDYDNKKKTFDKANEKVVRQANDLEGEKGQLNQKLAQLDSDGNEVVEKCKELNKIVTIEDWLKKFQEDYRGFMNEFSVMCADYKKAQTVRQEATAKIGEMRVAAEGLNRQKSDKCESLNIKLPESQKAEEDYKAKVGELGQMLGGKDPDALERELKSAINLQSNKVESALQGCHKLEVECAGLKAKEQTVVKQHKDCLTDIQDLKDKEGDNVVNDDDLQSALETIAGNLEKTDQKRSDVRGLINAHETCEKKMEEYKTEFEARMKTYNNWRDLNSILGNAKGDKLRETAQCFTLGFLVHQANAQLKTLGRRYALEQVKDSLAIRIIDHDRADEQRNVSSLSGGETFIISLALALGLSSISSSNIPIANLFVDEGFGSLDSGSLNMVIDALSALESSQGKKVGVISHTPEMRERIRTQIRVVKTGSGGKSYIEVKG